MAEVIPTGEEEIGRAVAGVGGALLDLGVRFDIIEAKTQLSESIVNAADAEIEFFLGLEGNEEPRTYSTELEKLYDNIDGLAPANRRASVIYNQRMASRKVSLALRTQKLARQKQESKAQAVDFLLFQKAKETGDFTTYKASIINGVKLGVYTAKEGEERLDDADKERDKKEKTDTLDMALTQRDEEGVLIVDKANEIVNGSDILNADEKTDLLNQITNRANQEQNQRDIQFRNRMGEEAGRLGRLLIDGELIEQEMDEIDLGGVGAQKAQEEEFKRKWKTILRNVIKLGEEAFVDKGEVLADIYDKIDAGTLTDELDTMVSKGLSPITAQRIKTEVRAPYEKDTEQLFKRIFGWSPELGFKDDFSGFLYEKSLREWQAEIKRQDATGEKIIEIGRSIVRPYFLEHLQRSMASDTDMTRMMELALGEETEKLKTPMPIEAEEPRREPGEPLTHLDFEREVSRLKGIDMEKARRYYDTWIGKFRKE